jgi:hypothetical protein
MTTRSGTFEEKAEGSRLKTHPAYPVILSRVSFLGADSLRSVFQQAG